MDYSAYKDLHVRRLEPGILEIVMGEEGGRLAVATANMHAEMARIWLDIDRDPETRVAILRGAGKGFSAGGDLAQGSRLAIEFLEGRDVHGGRGEGSCPRPAGDEAAAQLDPRLSRARGD